MSDAEGGTYTLLLAVARTVTVEVGALGTREFTRGRYAYTGSALGPGGFARVERHREVADGELTVRHWHIDYLLGHPAVRIVDAVTTPVDAECAVARAVADDRRPVPGVGASDCDCPTHLVAGPARRLGTAVTRAHEAAADSTAALPSGEDG